ncbi:retrovirus-related pol polyprotein from transposon TNT 1-94 [Tanacetum coccineum]
MAEMQKLSKDKCGLGYTETIAFSRNAKIKNLGDQLKKLSVEPACRCHSPTAPASSNEQHRLSHDSAEKKEDLETNGCPIISIGKNHGREFDNEVQFGAFCDANGITHKFLAPRTPPSNGVVEQTMKVKESLNVKFDETPPPNSPPLVDDDLLEVDIIENQSTDKAKITRKRTKPEQTRTRERKSTQRAGRKLSKSQQCAPIGKYPTKDAMWIVKEAQGMKLFTLESLSEEAQTCHNHGLPRWQSVCSKSNPTVIKEQLMIER